MGAGTCKRSDCRGADNTVRVFAQNPPQTGRWGPVFEEMVGAIDEELFKQAES